MKVVIWGNDKYSQRMKELVETVYSDICVANGGERVQVSAFVTEKGQEVGEISFADFLSVYKNKECNAIIIPKEYYMQYNFLIFRLIRSGVDINDIYNGARLWFDDAQNMKYAPYLLIPMLEDRYLSYLEYHVTDHCNLNCKYCTHYAPLVKKPVYTDLGKMEKDLKKLKEYIYDIGVIRILGGEPLLSPQLPDFIKMTREIYPNALITVVTNGMLLKSIDEKLIQSMKENKAFFHISYYPPLEDKIAEIKEFLVKNKLPFTMSEKIEIFNKTQILSQNPNPDFFYECFQATCTCIADGKIAPCFAPFTTKYFNEEFGEALPTDEGVDLYDENTDYLDIKAFLLMPMKRCSFCYEGKACKWEIIGKNSKKEDWV